MNQGFGVLGCHALNLGSRVLKIMLFHWFYIRRFFFMGLEQCSLDIGRGTLGFSKSLILQWFYELFLEFVHYGFGALSCRALKMLLFYLFYKLF